MSDPIAPSDFYDFTKVQDVQMSENYIFWVQRRSNKEGTGYTSQIYRYERDTKNLRPFTQENHNDYHPRISPDEEFVAFISNRSGNPQLYIQYQHGGEAIKVSESDTQIKSFAWSPDSNKLAYVAYIDFELQEKLQENSLQSDLDLNWNELVKEHLKQKREDPRRIQKLIYRTGTDYLRDWLKSQVVIYNLDDKTTQNITDREYNYQGVEWLDNLSIISFTKFDQEPDISDWLDLVKLSSEEKSRGSRLIRIYHPYIFDKEMSVNQFDTSQILIQTYEQIYDKGVRYQILKWGQVREDDQLEIINKDLDRSLAGLYWTGIHDALALINHHGKAEIRHYNSQSGQFNSLYDPEFSVESFSGLSHHEFVVTATSPSHPSTVWYYKEGSFSILHDPNSDLIGTKQIVEPEEFWLTNADGIDFQGWYFETPGKSKSKPLILSIHGGPHIMWNSAGTMWLEWQSQLAAGYSILALNPVGSDGYGEEFMRVIVSNWGKKDARDLLQALEYILENKSIDQNRIYVTGGSYAGFQTANLISISDKFQAACAQRGVYNLLTLDAGGDLARFEEIEYTGDVEKNVSKLWEDSPISRVSEINTPLLLIHSENDYRVPIHQAEQLFMELRRRGVEVDFIRYPEEGHELSRGGIPRRLVDRLEKMQKWFDTH